MAKMEKARELWGFFRSRKKWCLAAIIILLVILGAIMVLSQDSAVSPLIYAIF